MKAIFPYSITIRPNSKYDPSECLKLIEIQECESIRSKRKYKRLKFQAIKILDNSIETYNVYGYKIVWDNIESGKLKKKIPIYFNDYNYFISTEIIYKGVWIWQVKGIHNKMKIVKDFNIVIFESNYEKEIASRHLYYLGYTLLLDNNEKYEYKPYNLNFSDILDESDF